MRIYREISEVSFEKRTALTMGTFDGMHLGHRKLLETLADISSAKNLRSFVVTFDPHPRLVLSTEDGIKILSSLEEKLAVIEKLGIENVLVINFTPEFSKFSSREFLGKFIVDAIGISEFVIGYDHKFGRNRDGDKNLLESFGSEYGFGLSVVPGVNIDGSAVSSTRIRNMLKDGDIKGASLRLGYNYPVTGKVFAGSMRGRELGFPTANIEISDPNKLLPRNGVYAVECILDRRKLYGIMNIGVRPTFEERSDPVPEVHIFDFNEDIYSRELRINFIDRIRDEKRFNTKEELVSQIQGDIERAYSIIGNLVN